MANFQVHITVSAACGVAYGAAASWHWNLDWGLVFLAAGLTTIGGMLPDLDSDSGIPVRELFGLAGAVAPVLVLNRLRRIGLTSEQILVIRAGVYHVVRYVVAGWFKRATVHRGMFHSLPALCIAGLAVYLLYHNDDQRIRLYIACGVMIGFLSHLVLDEMYAVDVNGILLKANKYAGSALKLTSPSWSATAITYLILIAMAYAAWVTP